MNTWTKALAVASVASATWLVAPQRAEACGGCFVPPGPDTQVVGHRMVFSINKQQSTLYDQIEYTGAPSEFAWVLPIRGTVDIGLSSDLLFNQLSFDTAVTVLPPPSNCPVYNCGGYEDGLSTGVAASGGAQDPGVTVLASEVVGPYETVQLATTDPNALNDWLASHGYNVPSDIQPIITSYVNGGFNFLAMKLVPGEGIDKMRPVRITTQGGSVALPLKMVAAGTGATTTITLYVIAEGNYEPANFPTFQIPPEGVIWRYATQDSNYEELRKAAYDNTGGFGWLIEAALPYSVDSFSNSVMNAVGFLGPVDSGYSDDPNDYEGAQLAASEDIAVLFAGMNSMSVHVTALRAELSRRALGSDLTMAASDDQSTVSNVIQTKQFTGTQPPCAPPPPGCDDVTVTYPNGKPASDDANQSSSCAVRDRTHAYGATAFGAFAILVMLGLRIRRRR